MRSIIKGYDGKTEYTDSQNSDTTALSSRELYHLHFSLQVASPEAFGYTLLHSDNIYLPVRDTQKGGLEQL
jgi:hypothetical protein